MNIYVARPEKVYGPFSPQDLKNYLDTNQFNWDDLATHQSLGEQWISLRELLPSIDLSFQPPTSSAKQNVMASELNNQKPTNFTMVFRDINHGSLVQKINEWAWRNRVKPISISVTHSKEVLTYFHAFVIFEPI